MPPNNSFNPQPTPPQYGPSPEPASSPPPTPQPMQPAPQPFSAPAPSPSPMSAGPAPFPAPAPEPMASPQPSSPFGQPVGPAPQPFGQSAASDPAPAFGQQPPAPASPRKGTKMMFVVIAIILAVLVLGGGLWWYMSQNKSTNGASQSAVGDPESVATVEWVEPATVPANLSKSSQTSSGAEVVSYVDKTTFCTISRAVISLKDKNGNVLTSKQAVDAMLAAAKAQGVSVTTTKTGPSYTFTDDHSKTFAFDSTRVTQSLDVEGVPFKSQENILLYQKFGSNIATLSYACPSEAMDANQSVLEDFVKQFALKTT